MPMLRRNTRKIDDGPVYLTAEGLQQMQNRLTRLKRALPDLAAEAQRTAAYGDRSDSAEYKEAKGLLRRNHRQTWSLEDQLKRAVVIEQGVNASGTVQLGSTVVLESKEKIRKIYQILGPLETSPGDGRISHKSPLGAALIGHKKNDIVVIQTANGSREYNIIEIR